jgi:hypothetical protein
MPALHPVPLHLSVRLLWSDSLDNDVSTKTFWRYVGTAPDSTACQLFAAEFVEAAASFATLYPSDTQLTGCVVQDLSSISGGVGESLQTTPGTNSGAPLAGGTCTVLSYGVARRYRGGKPRNYFPWGTAADLVNRQTWTTAHLNNAHDLYTAWAGTVVGSEQGGATIESQANVSYYTGFTVVTNPITGRAKNVSTPRPVPVTDDVTGIAVRPNPGSQRRRNRA